MTADEIKKALRCEYGEVRFEGLPEALMKYFEALAECVAVLDKYEALKNKEKHEDHFYGLLIKRFEKIIADLKRKNDKNIIIDELVSKVKLKYLGVHPDELHNPHYAEDIVETIKEITEGLKEE